jgi:hypothetical protein
VDTEVTEQPDVADALGPALWQVDESDAGTVRGVLPGGGLLLDNAGRLTAVDRHGEQVWSEQTTTDGTREKDGSTVTAQHMGALLLDDATVVASYETQRTESNSAQPSSGVHVVLLDTEDGHVIGRVRLAGCGGAPPRQLGAGLVFTSVCSDGKTDIRVVMVTSRGKVRTVPTDTAMVVNDTPVPVGSGHASVSGPAWLVAALKTDGGVDPRRISTIVSDGRDLAVVQAPPATAASGAESVNVIVDFARKSVWRAPRCFVAGQQTPFPRSQDGNLVGVYATLVDRKAKKTTCLEDGHQAVSILALAQDGTILAKSADSGKKLLVVDPDGERTVKPWPESSPIAAAENVVYTSEGLVPGQRVVTAHRLKN